MIRSSGLYAAGRSPSAHGFSLIEALVLLTVLGLLVAVAAPALDTWLERYQVRTAAERIAADLQLQRMRAVSRNREFSVAFDVGAGTYTLFDGEPSTGTPLGSPVALPSRVSFSAAGDPVTLSDQGVDDVAVFHPDGTMNARLAQVDTITLANTVGDVYEVRINGVTGRIEVVEIQP